MDKSIETKITQTIINDCKGFNAKYRPIKWALNNNAIIVFNNGYTNYPKNIDLLEKLYDDIWADYKIEVKPLSKDESESLEDDLRWIYI